MIFQVISFALLFSFCNAKAQTLSPVSAANSESRSSLLKNKTFKADDQITDSRIKADRGSMARYSAILSLSYSGPPVGDLRSDSQPNPDRSVGSFATTLGGLVAVRYRVDSKSAINFGTGLNSVAPLHEGSRLDVRTPQVSIDRVFRFSDWQTRQAVAATYTTVPEYRAVGEVGGASYSSSLYHPLGKTRFLAGADSSLFVSVYDRRYERTDRNAARMMWGLYPTLKYKATDKLSAYTSYSLSFWNPRRNETWYALWTRTPSQRMGVEYAITRDIYVAPYLNFYAQNFSWDTTTVNVSTVFSVM